MRAAVLRLGRFVEDDVPEPVPGPGQVALDTLRQPDDHAWYAQASPAPACTPLPETAEGPRTKRFGALRPYG
ncbi:hypothetical protein ACIHCV_02465 [Streptomyces sp. NPDC051956]|uniref:hypothetical protein n=1 Tax=Streptomyces sp. NPDC051956 TaxID=3365677 RepID=UPI0037D4438F